VLFAYELGPLVAPGEGAFSNALIRLAGGDSVTASVKTPYPRISMETAIAMSPDVMIVGGMNPANEKLVKQELGKWTHLPAVRDGRVYLIDSTNLDRPSQRMMLGLRLLAKLLHPEAFADPSICATTMLQ
jgi:iron complex transport system substrate-binding protein